MDDVGWDDVSPKKYILSSGVCIMCLEAGFYPIELVKTRQQYEATYRTSSVWTIARQVRAQEGARGFFQGFGVQLCGSGPGQLIYFGSYEYLKSQISKLVVSGYDFDSKNVPQTYQFGINLAAGFLADVLSLTASTPFDVVSQRIIVARHDYGVKHGIHTPIDYPITGNHILQNIFKTEGYSGLYRGFGGAVCTYAPSSAIWFASYESSKWLLRGRLPTWSKAHDTMVHLVCGGIAGFMAAVITNPLDVARTRFQTLQADRDADQLSRGFWRLLGDTAKSEGVRGLARGIVPRVVVAVPGSAITFAAYEMAKRYALKDPQTLEDGLES